MYELLTTHGSAVFIVDLVALISFFALCLIIGRREFKQGR